MLQIIIPLPNFELKIIGSMVKRSALEIVNDWDVFKYVGLLKLGAIWHDLKLRLDIHLIKLYIFLSLVLRLVYWIQY